MILVTSPAEAHVLRLACIYAWLDELEFLCPEHLQAVLAVWDYCLASARCIFGDAIGDPTADVILREIRSSADGLSRTEISALFARNKSSNELSRALHVLQKYCLVARKHQEDGRPGRPTERWIAAS